MKSETERNLTTTHFTAPSEMSLREILNVLFRHKLLILTFFLVVVTTVTVGVYLEHDVYESTAKILIRVGRENISADSLVTGSVTNLNQNLSDIVNTEKDIIQSPYLAGLVVDNIGPYTFLSHSTQPPSAKSSGEDASKFINQIHVWKASLRAFLIEYGLLSESLPLPPRDLAINKFLKSLTVASEVNSQIINITFQAENAEFARHVMNVFISLYVHRHIEIYKSQASPDFIKEQLQLFKTKLTAATEQLELFKKKNGLISLGEQKELLMSQLSKIYDSLGAVNGQIDSAEASIASLEKSLQNSPSTEVLNRTTGMRNVAADEIKARLVDLRLKEHDFARKYQDNARPLVDVREQIKSAENELAKERAAARTQVMVGVNNNYQALKLERDRQLSHLNGLIAQRRSLNQELDKRKSALEKFSGLEYEHDRLQREINYANNEYQQYRTNFRRAEIYAAMDLDKVSNVSIVQPASFSRIPTGSHRFLKILLGVFLGLFGGLGIGLIFDYLDGTLRTDIEVRKKLGLPVLASFSDDEYQRCT